MSQRKRASLCCVVCNRRKVSCDKRTPCARCIQGGLQESCTRARNTSRAGSPQAAVRGFPDLESAEIASGAGYEASSRSLVSTPETRELHSIAEYEEIAHAATVLEFLAWGKRKETSFRTHLSPCIDASISSSEIATVQKSAEIPEGSWEDDDDRGSIQLLQMLLPDEDKVTLLVEYHLDCLLWYHGSFHAPTFRKQLAEFYCRHQGDMSSQGLDLQWVALLFSILAGSISCGNKTTVVEWGFEEAEQEVLSRKWLGAVVTCLNTAAYMANLSMRSCEAIATLTISAHILGYSNQQSVLLASAVRIAQSLGLHRLHSSSRKSVERETGRRVWAQLASQDWFSIPFSESYLINPLYSQSAGPVNCDDDSLEEVPDDVPTVTSYCRYLYTIAELMPALQDSICRSNTLYTKYNQVMASDGKLRRLASEQRPKFLCNVPLESSWPPWVVWARRAAAVSSAHKIIMIHRKFLNMSFTNSAFAFTRRTCIAASKTILKEVPQTETDGGPVLWIFHAFSVAAGVTLCLDALHRDGSDPICDEHCKLVAEATGHLRGAHNSKIASRGNKILCELLALEKKTKSSRNKHKRKLGTGDINYSSDCSRPVAIQEFVRDLQYRTSPEAARRGEQSDRPTSPIGEQYHTEEGHVYSEDSVLPSFELAEETLANFHSSYFSSNADAFGDLLNFAQTYSY